MDISEDICWKCEIRRKTFFIDDYLSEIRRTNSEIRLIKGKCKLCKDLLLIDDKSKYFVVRIPNTFCKSKKRRRNKRIISHDSDVFSFAFFKNDKIKQEEDYLDGQITDIINEIVKKAVYDDDRFKVTKFGISIELTPELRESDLKETNSNLKNCLRQLLIEQSDLKLDQNSDLYIRFLFSANPLPILKDYDGFVFSLSVSFKWKNLFIIGRYIKLSRRISQSKWNFSDENLNVDTSVEELIFESLSELLKFKKMTFSSSGREDVDVRMLGITNNNTMNFQIGGRPFAIEISNIFDKHYLFYSNIKMLNNDQRIDCFYTKESFIKQLGENIKRLSNSRLIVSNLEFSDISLVQKMNKEVGDKKKSYVCICYTPISLSNKEYDFLSKMIESPITINQRTPIRVLHRRANLDKERTIFNMNIVPINSNYFVLYLTTQAGTYIKEFINGDFGRTNPSLGNIIQNYVSREFNDYQINVTIVQLDVLGVH